jgi:hypothetical protein
MKTATQLSVFLKNEPGVLAAICDTLARQKINIFGMAVMDAVDHAVLRLVVSNPKNAMLILEERGMLVMDNEVLQLSIPNKPGTLGKVAARLARAKINIDYAYAAAGPGTPRTTLFMKVSDPRKAARALRRA